MIAKIKAILAAIKNNAVDTWNRCKVVILAVGAIIIALEFRKIKEALLVYAGQKEIKKDTKEDAQLKAKEDSANQEANALVQKAAEEPSKEKPIDDDWNKQ